jgi:putative hydrolase of the HAD superfamily
MIEAVIFDLDDTLLDRTGSLRRFLADQHRRFCDLFVGVASAEFRDRFLALDARGHVPKSVVYPAMLAEFGIRSEAAADLLADYREQCCRHAQAFAGASDMLTELRARGRKLAIVTNGETEFQTRHIDALGLAPLVDAILISEAEGLRKPDARLFRRAADRLAAAPEQCLFVGDNPEVDILGAHAAGMLTAWFGPDRSWPASLPSPPDLVIHSLGCILAHVGVRAC